MSKINVSINDLTPKQMEIAMEIIHTPASTTKYYIIRSSRQSGKTFLMERLAVYFSLLQPNKTIAFVNALHTQNRKVYTDLISIVPDSIIAKKISNDADRSITFINGSIIHFYTARNYDSIVGSSFDYFLGDEVALWPEQAWRYIQPTVAAKQQAKVVLSSTPRGQNHFYKLCMEGQSEDPFKKEFRMLYSDNPYYDLREVEDAKKNSAEFVWKQEYLAEFVFGRGAVFGVFSHLQRISQWGDPNPNEKYFFGLDIAGSGEDETVLTIIDTKGEVCFIYEATEERIPNQAKELAPIIRSWNAEGFGEYNGLGLGLCEDLQDAGINLHKFWTSTSSKQNLVSTVLVDIANDNLVLPTIELCSKLDNQMSTYEVTRLPSSGNLTYSHPKGLHDDYVDSLLLANWARNKFLFGGGFSTWDPDAALAPIGKYPTMIEIQNYGDPYDD
jgi:hypothetical protein